MPFYVKYASYIRNTMIDEKLTCIKIETNNFVFSNCVQF